MKPSDAVAVALVGTGGIGEYHAHLWRETSGAKVVGVCDVNRRAAENVARKYEIERVYDSLEDALADEPVHAVDVCTPNRFHAPVVTAALDAGKHCLCEKPLAATAAEIEQMIAARDRSGRLLMTAQHMRFERSSLALMKLIDAGELGDVYYTRAWWLRRRMAPTSPGLMSRAQAVHGPGLDIGVHMLDLAMHFMGHPQPLTVSGLSACQLGKQADVGNQWGRFKPADYEVEDFAAALVRFAGGAALSLEVSWLLNMNEPEVRSLWLHGTAGGASWPDLKLNHVRRGLLIDSRVAHDGSSDGHKNELAAFRDAILTGGPSPVPAEQSLTVARIIEALYESAETGHEVRL